MLKNHLYPGKLLALLSISMLCFYGQTKAQQNLEFSIDSLLGTKVGNETPGLAVGVIQNGAVLFSKAYGLANLEHRIPFSPQTISDIGSVAKQFTCYAILKLTEQGEIELDDPVGRYLSWIPKFDKEITIRHLIHHTSGLREIYGALAIGGYRSGDGIRQEDARDLVSNLAELNFDPGSQYLYCNTAYMLLADIVEAVTETDFESWMKIAVFSPLGMDDTYIMNVQGEVFPQCASSYDKMSEGGYQNIYDNSTAYGQGGIYTSMGDMLKWLYFLMYPGDSQRSLVDQMKVRGILDNGDTLNYAFGLAYGEYRGLQRIGHGGSSAGYRASLSFYPGHNLGIVLKSNTPDINLGNIEEVILDELLGKVLEEPEISTQSEIATDGQEITESQDAIIFDTEQFAGKYFSPELQAYYELLSDENTLTARHRRHGDIPLEKTGEDRFSSESWFFPELKFHRDSQNAIEGFRLSGGRILGLWFMKLKD